MEVRAAREADQWRDAAHLLFSYQRETAVEFGKDSPARREEVRAPVRRGCSIRRRRSPTYLVAYEGSDPFGGVGLVAQ